MLNERAQQLERGNGGTNKQLPCWRRPSARRLHDDRLIEDTCERKLSRACAHKYIFMVLVCGGRLSHVLCVRSR